MSLEWPLASILVETILALYSTVDYAEGNNSTSKVVSASVSTVIAFVELWISGFLLHWWQRYYLDQRTATFDRTGAWQMMSAVLRTVCIRLRSHRTGVLNVVLLCTTAHDTCAWTGIMRD
jgi:hypothetical protein